ncbi:MAG: hypothetical protein NXI24_18985 [bacterium]|nr:hypothetical protein [bacterium]
MKIAASEQETGFAFSPPTDVDFPRRVQAGEAIAFTPDRFPLLAPVPGIIDYDDTSSTFSLKTEGAVKFGIGAASENSEDRGPVTGLRQIGPDDEFRTAFLNSLRESGVPSLEYRGTSLFALFSRALAAADDSAASMIMPRVVLSRRDGEGGIDWNRLLGASEARVTELLQLFARLHPRMDCRMAPRGPSGPEYYGDALPEVVIKRLNPPLEALDPKRDLPEQGLIFLGPASLYALLDWFFEARPFIDRLTVLRASGAGRSQLFRLINGYDLRLLFQEKLDARRGRLLVKGNLIQNTPQALDEARDLHQNIFGPVSFHILRGDPQPTRDARLPCSSCMACQQVCPVDAQPFALVAGQAEKFRAQSCLECGLCDFVCESGIPLRHTIATQRKADGLPPRALW